jgi:hypothetical protein
MTAKKTAKETKPSTVVANDPDDLEGTLKNIGGSRSDATISPRQTSFSCP